MALQKKATTACNILSALGAVPFQYSDGTGKCDISTSLSTRVSDFRRSSYCLLYLLVLAHLAAALKPCICFTFEGLHTKGWRCTTLEAVCTLIFLPTMHLMNAGSHLRCGLLQTRKSLLSNFKSAAKIFTPRQSTVVTAVLKPRPSILINTLDCPV
jgi:hypothetical protein